MGEKLSTCPCSKEDGSIITKSINSQAASDGYLKYKESDIRSQVQSMKSTFFKSINTKSKTSTINGSLKKSQQTNEITPTDIKRSSKRKVSNTDSFN